MEVKELVQKLTPRGIKTICEMDKGKDADVYVQVIQVRHFDIQPDKKSKSIRIR